jgi:putative spermidine/putrescine transport system permease protein
MKQKKSIGDWYIKFHLVFVYLFLMAPTVIVLIAAFNAGEYLRFPPEGLSFRWFVKLMNNRLMLNSFFLSLRLALLSAATSTVLGLCAALYIVRYAGRLGTFFRPLILSPLVLPSILTGLALMIYFYSLGSHKTFFGLYAAHTLITTHYVFLVVSSVLYNFDYSMEEAARNLGAGRFVTFFKITLPHIKAGVFGGAIFAFISSFDQFPLSLMLTGPGFSTLPVQIFDYLRFEFDPTAAAISTFNISIAYIVVVIINRYVGLKSLYNIQ